MLKTFKEYYKLERKICHLLKVIHKLLSIKRIAFILKLRKRYVKLKEKKLLIIFNCIGIL